MNINETLEKMLASARELQRAVGDAALKANDQLHPLIQESLKHAQDLQATLGKHASETGAVAQAQTQAAMQNLNEYIKVGSDAMKQSVEQARASAMKMAEQSKQVVDSAAAAMSKPPNDPGGPATGGTT